MYQLYAYGTKYENCEKLYLIYPKDEVEKGNFYNYFKDDSKVNKLPLEILFFDLENPDGFSFLKHSMFNQNL